MSDKPAASPNNPAAPAGDPSMEDILASIRRILSEDEPPAGEEPGEMPVAAPHHPAPPEKDVLVLDSSMMVPGPEPSHPAVSAAPEPPAAVAEPSAPPPLSPSPESGSGLVAPAAAAAAASSVGALVRTLAERSMQVHRGGPTIEDLVRDEIRPILKEWLDQNLPPIVERLVRLEIERVVGRAVP